MIHDILTIMPAFVCAFMGIQLLLEYRSTGNKLFHWLIAWAFSATLLYIGHLIFFQHAIALIPVSDTIYLTMNLAVYPLYLIYISDLTDRHPLSKRKMMLTLMLFPAIFGGISCGIMYAVMNAEQTAAFINSYLYQHQESSLRGLPLWMAWIHTVCRIFFIIEVIGVAIAGIRKVKTYNLTLEQLYADTDEKEAKGLNTILKLLLVATTLSILANQVGRFWFVNSIWLALPSLAFSCLLFAIGWTGLHQRFSFRDIERQHAELKNLHPHKVDAVKLCAQLETIMQEEKIFLQHDVRLEDVAKRIGTNRTYLLQALNDGMHMTFKEYVNRKRIAHAEQLFAANQALTKSEVAILSGYNSMSAFYRNYNAFTTKEERF